MGRSRRRRRKRRGSARLSDTSITRANVMCMYIRKPSGVTRRERGSVCLSMYWLFSGVGPVLSEAASATALALPSGWLIASGVCELRSTQVLRANRAILLDVNQQSHFFPERINVARKRRKQDCRPFLYCWLLLFSSYVRPGLII